MRLIVFSIIAAALVTAGSLAQNASTASPKAAPAPAAIAPTTSPAVQSGGVEVRAMEEFNRGQYALALPLLKKAADAAKSQPDRLGTLQENIRVCERNLSLNQGAQQVALPNPVGPNPAMSSLSAERTPHPTPVPGQMQEMAIKDLGNFDYDAEKGGNIPADVKALDGSSIRLRGFMIPMDQAESITQFALVPSLFSCCFGQPPQIQHTIVVSVPKGKAVNYFPDEISVEGKLKVEEKKEDGFIVSIFEVDTTSVKPAPK